jgi:hypothetical protein
MVDLGERLTVYDGHHNKWHIHRSYYFEAMYNIYHTYDMTPNEIVPFINILYLNKAIFN